MLENLEREVGEYLWNGIQTNLRKQEDLSQSDESFLSFWFDRCGMEIRGINVVLFSDFTGREYSQLRETSDGSSYVYVYLDTKYEYDPTKNDRNYSYCIPGIGEVVFSYRPIYIGKGTDDRIDHDHNHNQHLMNIINRRKKEGIAILRYKLIDDLNSEHALKLEMASIESIGRDDLGTGPLTNKTDGGEGRSGWQCTPEAKENYEKAKRGKNHPNFGNITPDDVKEKISKSLKGKPRSEEARKNISKGKKGKPSGRTSMWQLRRMNPDFYGNLIYMYNPSDAFHEEIIYNRAEYVRNNGIKLKEPGYIWDRLTKEEIKNYKSVVNFLHYFSTYESEGVN